MTEKFASFMVKLFGSWAGTLLGKYIIIFILSTLPILELRGGLIAANFLGLPMWQSFAIRQYYYHTFYFMVYHALI